MWEVTSRTETCTRAHPLCSECNTDRLLNCRCTQGKNSERLWVVSIFLHSMSECVMFAPLWTLHSWKRYMVSILWCIWFQVSESVVVALFLMRRFPRTFACQRISDPKIVKLHTRTRTHTNAHAPTRTHTRTHTHTLHKPLPENPCCLQKHENAFTHKNTYTQSHQRTKSIHTQIAYILTLKWIVFGPKKVRLHTKTHTHTHTHTRTHTLTHIHTRTHTPPHTHTHTNTHTYTHIHTHHYKHTRKCVMSDPSTMKLHTRTCTRTHTQIYTLTHIHTYTRTHCIHTYAKVRIVWSHKREVDPHHAHTHTHTHTAHTLMRRCVVFDPKNVWRWLTPTYIHTIAHYTHTHTHAHAHYTHICMKVRIVWSQKREADGWDVRGFHQPSSYKKTVSTHVYVCVCICQKCTHQQNANKREMRFGEVFCRKTVRTHVYIYICIYRMCTHR